MDAPERQGALYRSHSETQTVAAACELAGRLVAGDAVLLYGDLGAGKTAFVRGLAKGLGADPDDVSSPTFTLMQEYAGRLPLRHLDLYRVESAVEIEDLGLDEAREGAVVAVEWAERLGEALPDGWRVTIRVVDEDTRDIEIVPPASR